MSLTPPASLPRSSPSPAPALLCEPPRLFFGIQNTTKNVRIRGRGANALTVSASAGIHATAAAFAFFLRCWADGGGGKGATAAGNSPPSSPPRALTIMDCPSLPPLAVLEAMGVENGAGLEYVALGVSSPPPLPSLAVASHTATAVRQRRAATGGGGGGSGGVVGQEPARAAGFSGSSSGGGGGGGGAGARSAAAVEGVRGKEEDEEEKVVEGGGEGRVAVASGTLKVLHVEGEGALTGVVLACPRLQKVDLLRCPRLW